MFAQITKKTESYLYRRGFVELLPRQIMLALLALTAISLIAGALLLFYGTWVLVFGICSLLVTINFWGLCTFFFKFFPTYFSKELLFAHLLRFTGRLILTAAILFVLMMLGAAPSAIIFGLSSAFIVITLAGVFYKLKNK